VYSEIVLRHFQNPHQACSQAEADLVGRAGEPGAGPHLLLFVRTDGERITAAGFDTYGCPAATACGSFVSSWVEGKSFEQAAVMEAADLSAVLGQLPLGRERCAQLAVTALRDVLRQAGNRQQREGERT